MVSFMLFFSKSSIQTVKIDRVCREQGMGVVPSETENLQYTNSRALDNILHMIHLLYGSMICDMTKVKQH